MYEENYKELANAIIMQAVKDYRANRGRKKIEKFLLSTTGRIYLRSISPESVINQLRKEVEEKNESKTNKSNDC